MEQEEKRRFFKSLVFPALLVLSMWVIKLVEVGFDTSFAGYGLEPQTFSGLKGIFFSPLLHADWAHLSSNSVPMFLLSAGLFYYYGKKATTIFILCWLVTGLWVWIFAKDTGIHIGASGVVYALATFHFMGGVLRREPRMMAFSLLVVFLYGSLVWGISPEFFPGKNISWQSHLLGGLAGIVIAYAYRGEGPQQKIYHWDEEDEEIEYIEEEPIISQEVTDASAEQVQEKSEVPNTRKPIDINYIYKAKE
ncbi:MAG: rhomboid family intramembrane serine protease [Bacteroidota bacterium]